LYRYGGYYFDTYGNPKWTWTELEYYDSRYRTVN
jgi:hypothetical protein